MSFERYHRTVGELKTEAPNYKFLFFWRAG
jgi:hypothetical protein